MNPSLPTTMTFPMVPPKELIEGVLKDKTTSILQLVDRRRPLLMDGLLAHWRGYLTGEYTMQGSDGKKKEIIRELFNGVV